MSDGSAAGSVLLLNGIDRIALAVLLDRYGLQLTLIAPEEPIPGSWWGDTEAGLRGEHLYARLDTPVHSVLHESSHFICMSAERRTGLDRDAGGDDDEEAAVCYLQLVLADELADVGRERLFADMDRWGYSFRLGNTRRWFSEDAADARTWLTTHGVLDGNGRPTGRCRE